MRISRQLLLGDSVSNLSRVSFAPESRPGGSEDPRVLVELVSLVEFTLQVKQVDDLSSQSGVPAEYLFEWIAT